MTWTTSAAAAPARRPRCPPRGPAAAAKAGNWCTRDPLRRVFSFAGSGSVALPDLAIDRIDRALEDEVDAELPECACGVSGISAHAVLAVATRTIEAIGTNKRWIDG